MALLPPESALPRTYAQALSDVRAGALSAEQAGAQLLAQLAPGEKLGLLDGDTPLWRGLLEFLARGYCLEPLVAGAVERLGIPGLRFTDGPRGVSLGRSTSFPVTSARGASWDVELEMEVGRAIGREARAQGANLYGGVCVNLLRHPAWGRAQETYGEDPVHLGAMGGAFTRGVREHVMACVKHFALNSIEDSRFVVDVRVDEGVLHEVYLPHFRAVVEAGADAVMTAYNSVNGRWTSEHRPLLSDILRGEWRFGGVTVSDFVWGVRDAAESLRAGLDVEMPFRQRRARSLPATLREGRLSWEEVDRAALRSLAAQLRHEAILTDPAPDKNVVGCDAHRALARRAASAGMVLLRNAGAVLPLELDLPSLAVVGRLADAANQGDRGSSIVRPPHVVRLMEGLRAALPATRLLRPRAPDVHTATEIARGASAAVVVVGWDESLEGELFFPDDAAAGALMGGPFSGRRFFRAVSALLKRLSDRGLMPKGGDRQRLELPAPDVELLRAVAAVNPRTVAIVVGGSAAVMTEWQQDVPAILMAWYPGMEAGHALADVLTGAAEPSGRLPTVFPRDASHLAPFDSRATQVIYDRWWGQRKLDRDGIAAAYPLGFGLGYTTFRLAELQVTIRPTAPQSGWAGSVQASVSVVNTGRRAGSAVIQLYAATDDPALRDRPRRQLLGFAKVQLAAGERRRVTVNGTLQPLARRLNRSWSPAAGAYRLEAAQYCGDPEAVDVPFTLSNE